jgi:ribosomal protein L17
VLHEKITTTTARAKELRPFVERLITKAKDNTLPLIVMSQSDWEVQPDAVKKLTRYYRAPVCGA